MCEKFHRKKNAGRTTQKKTKFKSYAEARKDRERFRKKLVELIMQSIDRRASRSDAL